MTKAGRSFKFLADAPKQGALTGLIPTLLQTPKDFGALTNIAKTPELAAPV
jgi:hypothetical protein